MTPPRQRGLARASRKPSYPPHPVTAVWLRTNGDDLEVLVEIGGKWRAVINELDDGPHSHIAESGAIASANDIPEVP